MRIFEFDIDGDKTWIWADDKEQAVTYIERVLDCVEMEDFCTEVPEEKWAELTLVDIESPEPWDGDSDYNPDDYSCGYKKLGTFADRVKELNTPDILATSEF